MGGIGNNLRGVGLLESMLSSCPVFASALKVEVLFIALLVSDNRRSLPFWFLAVISSDIPGHTSPWV